MVHLIRPRRISQEGIVVPLRKMVNNQFNIFLRRASSVFHLWEWRRL